MNSASRDPRFVEHAQRGVLRVDEIGRGFGDPSQRVGEGLLGADRHHRVEQAEQLLRAGELETTGHQPRLRPAQLGCDRGSSGDRPGGAAVIRVFLLDDHEVVRRGVRELLETRRRPRGRRRGGHRRRGACSACPATAPDVAVLDVRLPDGTGIEVCRDLRSSMPDLKCLMLTSFNDDEALFDAIMAGAVRLRPEGGARLGPRSTASAESPPASRCSIPSSPRGSSTPAQPARRTR